MQLYIILGIGFISTIMYLLVKQHKPEFAALIALAASIIIMIEIFLSMQQVMSELEQFVQKMNINEDYIKILLKCLGICYVVELASQTCKDAGVSSVASKIELAGKIMILLISLPLFESLLNISVNLMSQ